MRHNINYDPLKVLLPTTIKVTGNVRPTRHPNVEEADSTQPVAPHSSTKAPPRTSNLLMLALRSLFRTHIALSRSSSIPTFIPEIHRTMASSTAPLQEWLVIMPDFTGALDKRMAARPKHLEGLKSDRDDMWLWGGMSNFSHFQPLDFEGMVV